MMKLKNEGEFMKRKICIAIGIFIIFLIIFGIITCYIDSGRVTIGNEPKYTIKLISRDGRKVTYFGLGYKVIRYVGVSPNEPYKSNIGTKMGSWFMKYELPEKKSISIECYGSGKTIEITKQEYCDNIYNILVNSKYEEPLSFCVNTHKIIVDNEEYYLKKDCGQLQKGDKQAKLSQDDLETLLKLVEEK